MADAPDSKSGGVTPVWVQVPPSVLRAPHACIAYISHHPRRSKGGWGRYSDPSASKTGVGVPTPATQNRNKTVGSPIVRDSNDLRRFYATGRLEPAEPPLKSLGGRCPETARASVQGDKAAGEGESLPGRFHPEAVEATADRPPPDIDIVEFDERYGKPPTRRQDLIDGSHGRILRDFRDRERSTAAIPASPRSSPRSFRRSASRCAVCSWTSRSVRTTVAFPRGERRKWWSARIRTSRSVGDRAERRC